MAQVQSCWLCWKEWTFHDDEEEPFVCDNCFETFVMAQIGEEIREGEFVIPNQLVGEGEEAEFGEDD